MKKDTLIRLTAAEFLVAILISIAAVEAYDCHIIFVGSLVVSLLWYLVFFVANGIIN